MLKRLKGLGASESEILDVYMKQVRSACDNKTRNKTNRTSTKMALYIILGENYSNYEDAMDLMECESLNERIDSLCKKSARHPKFKKVPTNISTRGSEHRTWTKFKTRTNYCELL